MRTHKRSNQSTCDPLIKLWSSGNQIKIRGLTFSQPFYFSWEIKYKSHLWTKILGMARKSMWPPTGILTCHLLSEMKIINNQWLNPLRFPLDSKRICFGSSPVSCTQKLLSEFTISYASFGSKVFWVLKHY